MQQEPSNEANKYSKFWYSACDYIEEIVLKIITTMLFAPLDHVPNILKRVFLLPKQEALSFFGMAIFINILLGVNECIRCYRAIGTITLTVGYSPLIINIIVLFMLVFMIVLVCWSDVRLNENLAEYTKKVLEVDKIVKEVKEEEKNKTVKEEKTEIKKEKVTIINPNPKVVDIPNLDIDPEVKVDSFEEVILLDLNKEKEVALTYTIGETEDTNPISLDDLEVEDKSNMSMRKNSLGAPVFGNESNVNDDLNVDDIIKRKESYKKEEEVFNTLEEVDEENETKDICKQLGFDDSIFAAFSDEDEGEFSRNY